MAYKAHKSKAQLSAPILPLCFIVLILPLIVRLYFYDSKLTEYPWFGNDSMVGDVFLYYKSVLFTIICVIMAFITLGLVFQFITKKETIPFHNAFIPLAVYGLLSLISTIFSDFSYFGYHGIYEQFESIWVLLGYCLTAYYAYLFVRTEYDLSCIMNCLIVGIGIESILGVGQWFGHDFWASSLGQALIVPSQYAGSITDTSFNFADSQLNRVYMTLYNPNYVGLYATLVAPILLLLALNQQNIKKKCTYFVLLFLLLFATIGSGSKTALIAFAAIFIVGMILFAKVLLKRWYIVVGSIIALLFCIVSFDILNNHMFLNVFKAQISTKQTSYPLEDIQIDDNGVVITYNGNPIGVSLNDALELQLWNPADHSPIPYRSEAENHLIPEDDRFASFYVQLYIEATPYFLVMIDNVPYYFSNMLGDSHYHYLTVSGKPDELNTADSLFFEGREQFLSRRGYIWSRSLPLLKDYILLGSGADSFLMFFPNDDYIMKNNAGFVYELINKPHNLYLQLGVQSGVIALLAFLVFYAWYFVASIRLYFNRKPDTLIKAAGVGIFLGSVGYMVSGLTCDSNINVAPMFWALIGTGMAINHMVKESTNVKK